MKKFLKKFLLSTLALVVAVAAATALMWQPFLGQWVGERVFAAAVEQGMQADISDGHPPDSLIVGLCGAGSPLADPLRTGPCTFVKAGDQLIVIDAGSGASRTMNFMRANPAQLSAVLLTHFHSDHIDGLGELMLNYWAGSGTDEPLRLIGPPGVSQIAEGFNTAYGLDKGYRVAHHGEHFIKPSGFGFSPETIPDLGDSTGRREVYSHKGLQIYAFAVDHAPVHPAVGYRIEYEGRTVVISGDTTAAAESVLQQSKGVDLLIHEALQPRLVAIMQRLGQERRSRIGRIAGDIPDYHTSPEEVAEIAQAAGVRQVILNHIVPPLPTPLLHRAFLGDAASLYDGPLLIGRDGTLVVLPVDSEEVQIYQTLR